jgi:hypothetical protein
MKDNGHNSKTITWGLLRIRGEISILYPKIIFGTLVK